MNFFERLSLLDRRWVYLILAGVVIATVLIEFDTPIRVNPEVRSIYDFVDCVRGGLHERPRHSNLEGPLHFRMASLAIEYPVVNT